MLTQLARFKVPRDIVFVDDLPRTALGKVQHFMLRQLSGNADSHDATERSHAIAVLGGGNGSFAAAGDFALQGHDVRLWRRDAGTGGGASRGGLAHHRQGLQRPARCASWRW